MFMAVRQGDSALQSPMSWCQLARARALSPGASRPGHVPYVLGTVGQDACTGSYCATKCPIVLRLSHSGTDCTLAANWYCLQQFELPMQLGLGLGLVIRTADAYAVVSLAWVS